MTCTTDPPTAVPTTVRTATINHRVPFAPPRMDGPNAAGFEDMLRSYSPFGQLRTLLTLYRPGMGIGGYSGSAESFSIDHMMARSLGLSGFNAGLDRQLYGGGKGLGVFDMVASTAGEAVERMLGSFAFLASIGSPDLRPATHRQLVDEGVRCLGPDDLVAFHDRQYDEPGFLYERWEPDTPLVWLAGRAALDGERTWVPAQLVHMFHIMDRSERRVGSSNSGGLATHIDDASALYHAVLELVERDAINLRWYCRIPPARIRLDRPFRDRRITRWLEQAARARLDVTLYSHALDVDDVAVVTAVCWDPDLRQSSYFAGGGVGLSAEEAIRGAIAELVQSERMIRVPSLAPDWNLSWGINRLFGSGADTKPSEFSNFIQVVPYYGHAENRHKLDWYFEPEDQVELALSAMPDVHVGDGEEGWAVVRDMCVRHGWNPIVYDFTPEMFDTIRLVKVVVPELAPAFPPNQVALGHPRYREVPMRLGLVDRPLDWGDFSADPLPYP